MIKIINKNFLESDCKYIVHQCNCTSLYVFGLAKSVFEKYPYSNTLFIRNRTLGTISIHGNPELGQRYVINLYGQILPRKIKKGGMRYKERLLAFQEGLDKILEIPNLESVGFPYRIGCGLAGGDWGDYLEMLVNFSNKTSADVIIHKYE